MKDIPIKTFVGDIWFKRKTIEELREGESFNLVDSEGKFIAVFVVPASAEKKLQFQALAGEMNLGR